MAIDMSMRRRLLAASKFAYVVTQTTNSLNTGLLCTSDNDPYPYGKDVNYLNNPMAVAYGQDMINAVTVGRIQEGVLIAFRGTLPPSSPDKLRMILDWGNDTKLTPVNPNDLAGVTKIKGAVHDGFFSVLKQIWPNLFRMVSDHLAEDGVPQQLFITGHSKGGAVGNLAARALSEVIKSKTTNNPVGISVVTFEGARPGDAAFAADYNATVTDNIRYENDDDVVPLLPPEIELAPLLAKIDPNVTPVMGFVPVGNLRFIQRDNTVITNPSDWMRLYHIEERILETNLGAIVNAHSIDTKSRV